VKATRRTLTEKKSVLPRTSMPSGYRPCLSVLSFRPRLQVRLTSLPTPSWNAALAALRTPTSLSKHAARIRAVAISAANGSNTAGEQALDNDHNR